jgi:sugar fermentation stimulation protein A
MGKLMKGVYILVISLPKRSCIKIGSLGIIDFKKGYYAYTGSAMGGLEQRVKRHLRIDYFLQKAEILEVHANETASKQDECKNAILLKQSGGVPVINFGASDCKCKSHLFYFNARSAIMSNNATNAITTSNR